MLLLTTPGAVYGYPRPSRDWDEWDEWIFYRVAAQLAAIFGVVSRLESFQGRVVALINSAQKTKI